MDLDAATPVAAAAASVVTAASGTLLPANASAAAARASAIAAAAVSSADEQSDWSRAGLFVIAALQLLLVLVAYRLDKAPAPALVSESAWAMFFGVIVRAVASLLAHFTVRKVLTYVRECVAVTVFSPQFGAIIRFISPIVRDSHRILRRVWRRVLMDGVVFSCCSNRSSTPWTRKCSSSRTALRQPLLLMAPSS